MSDFAAHAPVGHERALAAFLVTAAIFALVAAAFLLVPPALRITRYDVSGIVSMTKEDVLSASLIHEKEYFFSLDTTRVKAALLADPRVASATVSKLFPNGLRIVVTERRSVAVVSVVIDGVASAVCLDSEGVAFVAASSKEAISVPVISGLRFEGFHFGMRLPPTLTALVASLGEIQSTEPALLSAISEIRMLKSADELIIYPLNQRIPVRTGASLDVPTLRSIILVLDVLEKKGLTSSVQELDFRTGTVVYRSKEGQSG